MSHEAPELPTPHEYTRDLSTNPRLAPLGDTYAYTDRLYAVRVPSAIGGGLTNKILFFPVNNGQVIPTVIGEYDYGAWSVYMGLHSN